ncbi:MAG: hypothetical protein KDI36_11930 [Pseudomonadales bacterium]|nr:hypothetical protein [Pseudomonadales bacterium]
MTAVRALPVLGLLTLIAGCANTRVEESRTANTGLGVDEAIVILGRASYNDRETEASFTECISRALSVGDNPIRLIPEDQFKDQLYPWFEPRTAPNSADDLARLFAQPGVQERIEEARVRYLAWIEGDTVTTDKGGSLSCTISTFGGGCFGMSYWEEDASYEASVWDLQNLTTAGEISADANGTSYLAGLVLPIPIMARPGNAACKALAAQLRNFLTEEEG